MWLRGVVGGLGEGLDSLRLRLLAAVGRLSLSRPIMYLQPLEIMFEVAITRNNP